MVVRWYNKETGKMEDYNPPPPPDAPFHIMPMFQEYQAVGVDNRIVKTRTDNKNMLKDHGLVEVGNEQYPIVEKKREERGENV